MTANPRRRPRPRRGCESMNMINGYRCDPATGRIYGKRLNRAIGRINGRGYVEISVMGYVGVAHRMIWESVHGPIPADMQINHINGIKTDNRIQNLELVTGSENCLHKYRSGLQSAAGESNGRAILNKHKVREIRRSSATYKQLATEYGVSVSTIRDVKTFDTWSDVA